MPLVRDPHRLIVSFSKKHFFLSLPSRCKQCLRASRSLFAAAPERNRCSKNSPSAASVLRETLFGAVSSSFFRPPFSRWMRILIIVYCTKAEAQTVLQIFITALCKPCSAWAILNTRNLTFMDAEGNRRLLSPTRGRSGSGLNTCVGLTSCRVARDRGAATTAGRKGGRACPLVSWFNPGRAGRGRATLKPEFVAEITARDMICVGREREISL